MSKTIWTFPKKVSCIVYLIYNSLINQLYICNFQEGVKPMWEDERNRRGGRWVINLNKSQRAQSLDKIWLEVMLCLIGEAFDDHSKFVSAFL